MHPMHRFDETSVSKEETKSRRETGGPHQASHWSPYQDNGGTSLAVAGDTYAVLAADTRLSRGYSILSRNVRKWKQLYDHHTPTHTPSHTHTPSPTPSHTPSHTLTHVLNSSLQNGYDMHRVLRNESGH